MDSQANQSFSDDQELAKVLAGVSQGTDNNLQFEETNTTASPVINPATISPDPVATDQNDEPATDIAKPAAPEPVTPTPVSAHQLQLQLQILRLIRLSKLP